MGHLVLGGIGAKACSFHLQVYYLASQPVVEIVGEGFVVPVGGVCAEQEP